MAIKQLLKVDYAIAEKPLESVNGDQAFFQQHVGSAFFGIVDGAGHGQDANEIATIACEIGRASCRERV